MSWRDKLYQLGRGELLCVGDEVLRLTRESEGALW